MLKRITIFLLTTLVLASCGGGSAKHEPKIVVIGKANNAYWQNVKLGAEAAGKALGVDVAFSAPEKEDSAWQIKKVEESIKKSVDGIAFAPSDPKSIAPSILKAMDADIPCIALDTDISKGRYAYVGTSNYRAGEQAGQKLAAILEDTGEIAILADFSSATDSIR